MTLNSDCTHDFNIKTILYHTTRSILCTLQIRKNKLLKPHELTEKYGNYTQHAEYLIVHILNFSFWLQTISDISGRKYTKNTSLTLWSPFI